MWRHIQIHNPTTDIHFYIRVRNQEQRNGLMPHFAQLSLVVKATVKTNLDQRFMPLLDKTGITAQSWNFGLGSYSLNKQGPSYLTCLIVTWRFVKSLLCNTQATSPDFILHLVLLVSSPSPVATVSLASQQSVTVNTSFTICHRVKWTFSPRDHDAAY